MAALGELIGGVVGLIVTPVELLEPDVPVLAPIFEGEPSRMVSRDTDGVAVVPGLDMVAAEAPLSICNLNSLGAEGSKRSCSTGEIGVLLGASDEPGAVVVLVDGAPLGASVGGPVVALGVVGGRRLGQSWRGQNCEYGHYEDLVHDAFLFLLSPPNRKLEHFFVVP